LTDQVTSVFPNASYTATRAAASGNATIAMG